MNRKVTFDMTENIRKRNQLRVARHHSIFKKALLALTLLMVTAGVKARDYVLTWTSGGTTYYVGMNGNAIAVKTSFDPTCIWTCYNGNNEANLGTTSYSLRNKNNSTYYLTTTCTRSGTMFNRVYTWSALTVQNSANNIWRSSNAANGNVYAREPNWGREASIRVVNNTWEMYDTNTNGSQNYQVTTAPHDLVQAITLPTISISGTSGKTITFSHTDLTGTYTPAYTDYTINGTHHYWYDNSDHTQAPSSRSVSPTYRWSVTSGNASIDQNGVLTLNDNVNSDVRVRLHVENLGSLGDKTVDFTLAATPHTEEVTTTGEVTTPTITPSPHTMNYGERQEFTASASATVTTTTTPSYTVLTGGGNTYYYYGGTLNNAAPSASDPVVTHPVPTYTWALSGAAATGGYLTTTSTSGASATVSYGKISTSQVTGTLTVTASIPEATPQSATATITATQTTVSDVLVYPETIVLGVGENRQFSYTLQPLGITATVTPASGNTGIATLIEDGTTITVHGVAVGETAITLTIDGLAQPVTVPVTVRDRCATPTITITPDADGTTATVTLSTATTGTTIYYTIYGGIPSTSSFNYTTTGSFTISNGQTVNAVAMKSGLMDSEMSTATYSSEKVATPTITIAATGTTFDCATAGVTYYYTTDGSTPTTSSTAWSGTAITGLTDGATIQVIATKAGMINSDVASQVYHPASSIDTANGIVTINDLEDHNWSYYSDPECPIKSLYPRNVKITYYGNGENTVSTTDGATPTDNSWTAEASGVKVGIASGESQNTFVYYKTLERDDNDQFPYELIPNPFQVRPTYGTTGNSRWRGFYKWRVKNITNGAIYNAGGTKLADGDTESSDNVMLDAETTYYFQPTNNSQSNANNATSMEVELEALWARAYVVTSNTTTGMNTGVSYERNFMVLASGNNVTPTQSASYQYTVSSLYPNGTTNGTDAATAITATTLRGTNTNNGIMYLLTLSNNLKIEYIRLNGGNFFANSHDLIIGRGVICSSAVDRIMSAGAFRGNITNNYDQTIAGNINNRIRIESGTYNNFIGLGNRFRNNNNWYDYYLTFSGTLTQKYTFGCDYDRSKGDAGNNNLKMVPNNSSGAIYGGQAVIFSNSGNKEHLVYDWNVKSGIFHENLIGSASGGDESIYLGSSQNGSYNLQYAGKRRMIVEGGNLAGIAGGMNSATANGGDNYNNTTHVTQSADDYVVIRIKGNPTIRSSVYGAAAFAGASGGRKFIFTGGSIAGWVAGGANGTQTDGGTLYGPTNVYIGGKTSVDSNNSTTVINRAVGGNVFGAGCGFAADSNSGQVLTFGTTTVVADDAYIERGVYGGGSYGYTTNTADIYVLGGHVGGKDGGVDGTTYSQTIAGGVFGGACQNNGGTVNITMADGLVEGGVYGGSNVTGTISNSVTMNINGGQVGTPSADGVIHGGGLGNATRVLGSVNLTLGASTEATDYVTVYGDVYGGSAQGKTNGNNNLTSGSVTNVTLNKGIVHGNVYGGGLGTAAYAADVYGPVTVVVNGGAVTNDDLSAGVFGCNNVNGAPQNTVTVTVNGTDDEGVDNVFGGGNHADYPALAGDDYPTVDINGGTVNNSVYGGGNEADIKGNANVTMTGGTVKNRVFGGGNLGNVGTFNTTTTIANHTAHAGCIGWPASTGSWTKGGKCTVTITGGTVGDFNRMVMPDDYGYVFGASRGTTTDPAVEPDIDFTAYVKETEVTIKGTAFILGGVYGGSENGHVRGNTEVYIQENCQIGCGEGLTAPYTDAQWTGAINAVTSGSINDIATYAGQMPECSHWKYEAPYLPYDLYDAAVGGANTGSDGHTFYGNVFGGGSGYWPYEKQSGGYEWLEKAGLVEGDTYVEISGGHILTSIYGGNELTDVLGNCHVKMTGGTLGVPRTVAQAIAHPVTCYLFGAGKGDQRLYFTNRTNVGSTTVEVEGGTIFGSVFGGGEDGHVTGDASVTIGKSDHTGPHIGTTGTSYVDGNIFGGGRGFSGDALTGGLIQGNVTMLIQGGTMLGSIYGGGRLGSVGTYLVPATDPNYGKLVTENTDQHGNITIDITGGTIGNTFEYIVPTGDWTQAWKDSNSIPYTEFGSTDTDKNRLMHTKGGNVFTGCMGRLYKLDNTYVIHNWPDMGKARTTTLTITGGTIKSSVYGGGEMGPVIGDTKVSVSGSATIIGSEVSDGTDIKYTYGSVFGGGYGSSDDTNGYSVDEPGLVLNARDYAGVVRGSTDVDITSGRVWASVYGGGELATVRGDTDVDISGDDTHIGKEVLQSNGYVKYGGYRMGNVFGGGKGSLDYPAAGGIKGNATVLIHGGNIYHNVYGGGALGSVGTYVYNRSSDIPTCVDGTGTTTVTITAGTIGLNGHDNGMVNGSSRGGEGRPTAEGYTNLDKVAWVNHSIVNIGTSGQGSEMTSPWIKGSVYGGGENGHNYGNTTINIYSGHIGTTEGDFDHGNIYGAGCGTDTYSYNDISYSNPMAGIIHGNSTVNIMGGKIERDVYGAGSMGSTEGNATVTVTGGRVGGNVYGGPKGRLGAVAEDHNELLADIVGNTRVDINYSSTPLTDNSGSTEQLIAGSVFGGGEAGPVKGNVEVNMLKGLVLQDVYGGGALANTNIDNVTSGYGTASETIASTTTKTTKVNLTGGIVGRNVYGGGLGRKKDFFGETSDLEAKVYGDVTVELNKDQTDDQCWVKGTIFGCNNLNGTPKGHALVHIYKTVTWDSSDHVAAKPAKNTNSYELAAVYGGGNMAAYEPLSTTDFSEVIIEGCDYTSIETVYGGGNAASTPASKVTVESTYEIGTIFGGGNGKDALDNGTATPTENPGAHVGYKADGETEYGTGDANVNALGGMIHKVFGGSNTKGNVRNSSVAFIDQADDTCPLELDEVYGGGNEAYMNGDPKVKLGCISFLKNLYGGANNARVGGDVELTVTSGRFERIFGGNNQGGTINGGITVNIEETGCYPIVIGELYGCGNQAAYTTIGAKHPVINIKSFTSIGRVFGGGLGSTAIVTGNPTVNVNTVMGDNNNSGVGTGTYTHEVPTYFDADGNFKGWTIQFYDDPANPAVATSTLEVPTHEKGKIGAIGTVFGGGNAAKVEGNTTVNIGTATTVDYVQAAPGETDPRTGIQVLGADIRGNVFGGGNQAEVDGNTNVNVGK